MSQEEVYKQAGFGQRIPRGNKPAIVVVDFSYGFSDTQYPTAANMEKQIAATKVLTDLARSKKFPVIYTTIAYHEGEVDTLPWLKKAAGLAALLEGSRLVEIDVGTNIQPNDIIISKKGASAFFGTSLAAVLTAHNVDTVIITGATTSGCVRASVVDAVQSGFNVLVPEDCCADRAQAPHDAAMYDIDQKYGDVTDSKDIYEYLQRL